jgi:hypothetical protein
MGSRGRRLQRWAEDVSGAHAPWVRLARLYLRAATLPERERTTLLETQRAVLQQRAADRFARLMAADIARQLAPSDAHAKLADETPGAVESSVVAALRRTRRAAIEAGN